MPPNVILQLFPDIQDFGMNNPGEYSNPANPGNPGRSLY
jgi:hypothetical protein